MFPMILTVSSLGKCTERDGLGVRAFSQNHLPHCSTETMKIIDVDPKGNRRFFKDYSKVLQPYRKTIIVKEWKRKSTSLTILKSHWYWIQKHYIGKFEKLKHLHFSQSRSRTFALAFIQRTSML